MMPDFKFSQQFLDELDREDLSLTQGADPEVAHTRYAAVCNPEGEPLAVLWEIDERTSVFEVEQELLFQLEGVLEG